MYAAVAEQRFVRYGASFHMSLHLIHSQCNDSLMLTSVLGMIVDYKDSGSSKKRGGCLKFMSGSTVSIYNMLLA